MLMRPSGGREKGSDSVESRLFRTKFTGLEKTHLGVRRWRVNDREKRIIPGRGLKASVW